MRTVLFASVAVLALGGTGFAQGFSGNSPNNPKSTSASNITAADTHSHMAPALPSAGYDLTYEQFLQTAQKAVDVGKTGLAQQSLEQAETRLLTRSVPQGQGNTPDDSPRIAALHNARIALSKGDKAAVLQNIQMAMETPAMSTMKGGAMAPAGTPQ